MRALVLILAIAVLPVANRCAGEAHWPEAVHLCACTVKARLDQGWSPGRVLSAYYAPSARANDEMIAAAKNGLAGNNCPDDAYYFFGAGDVRRLRLDRNCATAESHGNGKTVYSFGRNALRECR